jgi:GntR family transcriptional regulator
MPVLDVTVEWLVALDRRSPTPLYRQIRSRIAADIRNGILRPGDRVASETELERIHGVSRITVRQAIASLVQDGDLYRVPGKGTYVSSPTVAPLAAFTSFSENMRAQGLVPSYRVISSGWEEPADRVRSDLELGPDERVFRLERLLLADGEPMCLQYGNYPERLLRGAAPLLTQALLNTTSLYALFEERLNLQLERAEEIVEPALANRKEVRLLGIAEQSPVLVVRRIAWLVSGDPVESVKLVFRGDKYRYRVDLLRGVAAGRPGGPLNDRSQAHGSAIGGFRDE